MKPNTSFKLFIRRAIRAAEKRSRNRLEIILYHSVSSQENPFNAAGRNIHPTLFEAQMKYLQEHHVVVMVSVLALKIQIIVQKIVMLLLAIHVMAGVMVVLVLAIVMNYVLIMVIAAMIFAIIVRMLIQSTVESHLVTRMQWN